MVGLLELLGLTLFGNLFFGAVLFALILFVFFIAEIQEEGWWATTILIIAGVLYYFWGGESFHKLTSLLTTKTITIYCIIGFLYSIIKIYFFARIKTKKTSEKEVLKDGFIESLKYDVKENFLRWWFLWPVSIIIWFVKDMISEISDWFYSKFDKFFSYILMLGIKSITSKNKK